MAAVFVKGGRCRQLQLQRLPAIMTHQEQLVVASLLPTVVVVAAVVASLAARSRPALRLQWCRMRLWLHTCGLQCGGWCRLLYWATATTDRWHVDLHVHGRTLH